MKITICTVLSIIFLGYAYLLTQFTPTIVRHLPAIEDIMWMLVYAAQGPLSIYQILYGENILKFSDWIGISLVYVSLAAVIDLFILMFMPRNNRSANHINPRGSGTWAGSRKSKNVKF